MKARNVGVLTKPLVIWSSVYRTKEHQIFMRSSRTTRMAKRKRKRRRKRKAATKKTRRAPSQEIKVQQDANAGEEAPQPCGCACVYSSVPPSSYLFMSLGVVGECERAGESGGGGIPHGPTTDSLAVRYRWPACRSKCMKK